MSTTPTPAARAPAENASESSIPDSRMSRATKIRSASREAGETPADRPAFPSVELIGHGASHVVRLEDDVEGAHREVSLPGGQICL